VTAGPTSSRPSRTPSRARGPAARRAGRRTPLRTRRGPVFAALAMPLASVRVLIVGQDPYPTPGHAIGLAFAVERQVRPLPPSLVNLLTEYEDRPRAAPTRPRGPQRLGRAGRAAPQPGPDRPARRSPPRTAAGAGSRSPTRSSTGCSRTTARPARRSSRCCGAATRRRSHHGCGGRRAGAHRPASEPAVRAPRVPRLAPVQRARTRCSMLPERRPSTGGCQTEGGRVLATLRPVPRHLSRPSDVLRTRSRRGQRAQGGPW
jgi:hypothetical protein